MPAVYGNAPEGEYPATFTGAFEARYPRGNRLLFGFLILRPELDQPQRNDVGQELWAVGVCNVSDGTNPKSKPFRIRRAMLEVHEYDPIQSAFQVPPSEHFTQPRPGGSRRTLSIRVARKQTEDNAASIVTHIRRPRDNEWECIESQFEGRQTRFRWLNVDGTARPYSDEAARGLPELESNMWLLWNQNPIPPFGARPVWIAEDGSPRELTPDEFRALGVHQQILYRVARVKAGLNAFVFD